MMMNVVAVDDVVPESEDEEILLMYYSGGSWELPPTDDDEESVNGDDYRRQHRPLPLDRFAASLGENPSLFHMDQASEDERPVFVVGCFPGEAIG